MAFTRTVTSSSGGAASSFSRSQTLTASQQLVTNISIVPPKYACTANASNEQITCVGHGLTTGHPFKPTVNFTGAGAMPGNLTEGTIYYAIVVDADTIQAATSISLAVAATAVNISSNGGTFGILPGYVCDTDIASNLENLGDFIKFVGVKVSGVSGTTGSWDVVFNMSGSTPTFIASQGNDIVYPPVYPGTAATLADFFELDGNDVLGSIHIFPQASSSPHTVSTVVDLDILFNPGIL